MNYRFLPTETNSKALYIFCCFNTTSSVKLFVVTVQIFVYKYLFTIVFFGKRKKNDKTFGILKMKTPSFNNFENAPSKRISLYCALVSGFSENANNVADAHRDAQTNR